MTHPLLSILTLMPLLALTLSGCTCGFDCSSDDDGPSGTIVFDLGLSGASPGDLKEVVIELDKITLRAGSDTADDVEIDTFSVLDPNGPPEDTLLIDLLQYPGAQQLLVIEQRDVIAGDYSDIVLGLITDPGRSTVLQSDDRSLDIVVSNNTLNLPGIRLTEADERYTVEFELARALEYEINEDRYRLTNEGVRVTDNSTAARILGSVDEELFDIEQSCEDKDDRLVGNRVYLYEGQDLADQLLADVFNGGSADDPPQNAEQPFAVAGVRNNPTQGTWDYIFSFLPPGDYTLAFTCAGEEDDPADYDGLSIPLPGAQRYEIRLGNSSEADCDIEENSDCPRL